MDHKFTKCGEPPPTHAMSNVNLHDGKMIADHFTSNREIEIFLCEVNR